MISSDLPPTSGLESPPKHREEAAVCSSKDEQTHSFSRHFGA